MRVAAWGLAPVMATRDEVIEMMHGNGWDHMGSWGWIGMLLMLAFWFGTIWLIVWAIAGSRGGRRQPADETNRATDQSMSILRERFARGEITAEEFEQARRTLEQQ